MAEPHAQSRPSRRRVPRWVWFALACLVLSVLTTIAVAWMFAPRPTPGVIISPIVYFKARPDGPDGYARVVQLSQTWAIGTQTNHFEVMTTTPGYWSHGPKESKPFFERLVDDASSHAALRRHLALPEDLSNRFLTFSVQLSGWPFLCLGCEDAYTGNEIDISFFDNPPIPTAPANPGPPLQPTYDAISFANRSLPLRPLWPGFLANTAAYFVVWQVVLGGLLIAGRWLIRTRRVHMGGCPACGYSREGLKVDAPCPECGRTPTPAAPDATPAPAAPTAR